MGSSRQYRDREESRIDSPVQVVLMIAVGCFMAGLIIGVFFTH